MKQSLAYVSAHFNCERMIREYQKELYEPSHSAFARASKGGFKEPRERMRFAQAVAEVWPKVRISDCGIGEDSVLTGSAVPVRATVELAGLLPEDVKVEAVVGRVGPEGSLTDTQVLSLAPIEEQGSRVLFGRDFTPLSTGRLGCSVRISPNHFEDPLTRPCNAPLKWADEG